MKQTRFDETVRMPLVAAAGLALALMAAAGCGGRAPSPAAGPARVLAPIMTTAASEPPTAKVAPPVPTATTTLAASPADVSFSTPQAAMSYLAAAYNSNDAPALKKVTNASARAALIAMRQEATNLQLTSCSRRPVGDYLCQFRHDYPQALHRSGRGRATFLAAPADKRGWYMTVLVSCG